MCQKFKIYGGARKQFWKRPDICKLIYIYCVFILFKSSSLFVLVEYYYCTGKGLYFVIGWVFGGVGGGEEGRLV